jgi:hypothetical protein
VGWLWWRRPKEAQPVYTMDYVRVLGGKQDLRLRWIFASFGLAAMTAQIVIATIIFFRYGDAVKWELPDGVIAAYLGSAVAQVVGIVMVMTKSLFPEKKD